MIKIEKINNPESPDIRIKDGNKSFMIARNGLPDLAWYPEGYKYDDKDNISFTIKEEDREIYFLFERLYQNLINGDIFPLMEDDLRNKTLREINKLQKEQEVQKTKFREMAQRVGLITGNEITVHSEDHDEYELASILTIKKISEGIEIIFSKNKRDLNESYARPSTYLVRITESGGAYGMFYIPFVNFLRELQNLVLSDNKISDKNKNLHI